MKRCVVTFSSTLLHAQALLLQYSFVGSKQTVKQLRQAFLAENSADELITASTIDTLEDRLKSVWLFAEVMQELNEGR
jgi:hypothetical protein